MGLEKEVQAAQGALGRGRGDVLRPLEEGRLEARKVREVHFEGWVLVDSALLVRVSRALVGPVLAGQNAAVVLGVAERNYGGVGRSEKARLARAVGKELAPSVTFMIAPTFSTASTSGPVENWAQPGQRASVHASTGTGCAALLYAVASVGRRSAVESVRDTVMAADFQPTGYLQFVVMVHFRAVNVNRVVPVEGFGTWQGSTLAFTLACRDPL